MCLCVRVRVRVCVADGSSLLLSTVRLKVILFGNSEKKLKLQTLTEICSSKHRGSSINFMGLLFLLHVSLYK